MGMIADLRNRFRRTSTVGVEIGDTVAAVEVRGDPPHVTGFGDEAQVGYRGSELGIWLRRWLPTTGTTSERVHVAISDGALAHYLVPMPEMSDRERDLAVGAEVRKRSTVPAGHVLQSHSAVGTVEEDGVRKQQVLVAVADRGAVQAAVTAVKAAGLEPELVTTVPAALANAARLLPASSAGTAIAYLSARRSYVVVQRGGTIELVRDFALQGDIETVELAEMVEAIAEELRRSFLYFGQRGRGAKIEQLVLAGPLPHLRDLTGPLMEALGVDVELFDAADRCELEGLGERGANFRQAQPKLAAALGAAALPRERQNLLSRDEAAASDRRLYSIAGAGVAGVLLLGLVAWGLIALLMGTWRGARLDELQQEVATLNQQVAEARATEAARAEHRRRRALLEHQAQESGLVGALLQRLGRQVPDEMVFERIEWFRALGAEGEPHWTAQVEGLVLGGTRTESQAVFSRFFNLLASDPIVHDVRLVEPLVIGAQEARPPNPIAGAVQESFSRRRGLSTGSSSVRGAEEGRPVIGSELFEDTPSSIRETPLVTVQRTSLDDLPPFEPTTTSVGFKMAIELLTVATGGSQ